MFVERTFAFGTRQVHARFHEPYRASSGEYWCRWSIFWPDHEDTREAAGLDGVQALMLAMQTVNSELQMSEAYHSGELTYCGGSDLDLPPGWGQGRLYDPGPDPSDELL